MIFVEQFTYLFTLNKNEEMYVIVPILNIYTHDTYVTGEENEGFTETSDHKVGSVSSQVFRCRSRHTLGRLSLLSSPSVSLSPEGKGQTDPKQKEGVSDIQGTTIPPDSSQVETNRRGHVSFIPRGIESPRQKET